MGPALVLCAAGDVALTAGWLTVSALPLVGKALTVAKASGALSGISWWQCARQDPGRVPQSWRQQPGGHVRERKKSGEHRYCQREGVYKPDRAHYCSPLGRNVLRLDHFCPWLGVAVGHGNHKSFLLILFYGTVALTSADTALLATLCHAQHLGSVKVLLLTQGCLLSSSLLAVVCPMLAFQVAMLAQNMTTLEFFEKHEASSRFNRYDIGVFRNLQSVLGEHPFLWPVPCGTPLGNGLYWEAVEESGERRDARALGQCSLKCLARSQCCCAVSFPKALQEVLTDFTSSLAKLCQIPW